jgi:hypothetical protein
MYSMSNTKIQEINASKFKKNFIVITPIHP